MLLVSETLKRYILFSRTFVDFSYIILAFALQYPHQNFKFAPILIKKKIRMKFRLLCAMICFSFAAFAQPNLNLELLSQTEVGEAGNDIWGFVDDNGIEYAVMGTQTATRIFSLEDNANPILRSVIPGASSIWRDIKHYDNYLYVTTDQGTDGLLIVDMTNAPDLIEHKFWTPTLDAGSGPGTLGSCHNLYVDAVDGWCYLAGCSSIGVGGVLILDIHTDPLNPIHVGSTNEFYSHDVVQLGNFIYSSEIGNGHFSVYDVTDKANPERTILQSTTSNYTHNAWPSDDGAFLFTTDERPNAYVDSYDISDPSDVQLLDFFQPLETAGNDVIPHNTHYDEGYLVTSWYTDGVVIVDANKPDNLIKVGAYDTFLGPDGGFSGCWGVYPYLPSGTIIASDINSGLYVFSSTVNRACYLEGNVIDAETGAPITIARVEIDADQMAFGMSDAGGNFKSGLATAGTYTINASHPEYLPAQVEVELENGMVTNVTIEMTKQPVYPFVGNVVRSSDGSPIEGAQVVAISAEREIIATSASDGTFDMTLFGEDYTFIAGAWGYNEEELVAWNPTVNSVLEIKLDEGYKDDFVVDQGWTVIAGADTGNWERGVPNGTQSQGQLVAPNEDVQDDEFGDIAYVTGNFAGGGAGTDDVDDGITTLTSKPMDLSNLESPSINFSYWFVNTGGQGADPDDMITVLLSDGVTTVEADVITANAPAWRKKSIDPSVNFDDLSNISISFEVGDQENSGHLVEAGIDQFFVSTITKTKDLAEFEINIGPNPFSEILTISTNEADIQEYIITDAVGKIALRGKIINGEQLINTGNLTEGVYFIQLKGDELIGKAKKIIKH